MEKKFSDLVARTMSSERIKVSEERVKATLLEINLQELQVPDPEDTTVLKDQERLDKK